MQILQITVVLMTTLGLAIEATTHESSKTDQTTSQRRIVNGHGTNIPRIHSDQAKTLLTGPNILSELNNLGSESRSWLNSLRSELRSELNSLRSETSQLSDELEKALPPIGSIIRDTGNYSSENWQVCDGSTISRGPLSGKTTPIKGYKVWSDEAAGVLPSDGYNFYDAGSLAACQAQCEQDQPRCRSLEYILTGESAGLCFLHSRVRRPGEALRSITNRDWHYYELTLRYNGYIMRIL